MNAWSFRIRKADKGGIYKPMKQYFAPLEGITTFVYRNVHYRMFGGIDKYYTPFVSPSSARSFKSREKRDVLPENNRDIPVVPQILSNHADEFLYTAECLAEYGYQEINLNLGCPSGTVASKGRGAGFLASPEALARFLEEIYSRCPVPVSIKTRIGWEDPEEFYELIKIYNRYPVHELTIHPRLRQDFYKNKPNLEIYELAEKESKNPLCYNGDITTVEAYQQFCERFPDTKSIMIGRGLIADPFLAERINGSAIAESKKQDEVRRLARFEEELRKQYLEIMPGEPTLFKMKEIWAYMYRSVRDGETWWKKIKKAKRMPEYEKVMTELFYER